MFKGGLPVLVYRFAWHFSLVLGGTALGTLLTTLTPAVRMQPTWLAPVAAIAVTVLAVLLAEQVASRPFHGQQCAREWRDPSWMHTYRQAIQAGIASQGWLPVASQLIADALAKPAFIGPGAALLDASSSPAPRFAIPGVDGRRYCFTVSPKLLKKHKLILGGARVIALRDVGLAASIEAQTVWDELMRSSNTAGPVFIPRNSAWYLLVEEPRAAPKSAWAGLIHTHASGLPSVYARRWTR